ncbi:MAG: hypothetical protein U1E41_14815 [Paracoccus sp. (in: a-proteobacteria)]
MIACLTIGAVIGWVRAANQGGKLADKLQYAAAHALALSIPGVFLTILLTRMG